MPIQTTIIKTPSLAGVTVHNQLLYHDDPASARLMVMLPGRGYTCDHPVLYYVRRMAVKHDYDVLSIEYGFQVANLDLTSELSAHLEDEVNQAVMPALQRGYSQVCIVGKSLGTPLASGLAHNIPVADMSLILLTPIGGAFQGVDTIRTLAVIGTDDPLYSPELVASYPAVEWQVFDGLNHSLEVRGDWRASISALDNVITVCETFLVGKAA
jgi:hypothetical protein